MGTIIVGLVSLKHPPRLSGFGHVTVLLVCDWSDILFLLWWRNRQNPGGMVLIIQISSIRYE